MKKRVKNLTHFLISGVILLVFIGITISRLILKESLFTNAHFIDFVAYTIIWISVLYVLEYFNIKKLNNKNEYFRKVVIGFFISLFITLFIRFFEHGSISHWRVNLVKNFVSSFLIAIFLYLIRVMIYTLSNKNILIIGGSFSGRSVAREIISTKSLNLNLVGYISDKSSGRMKVFGGDEVEEDEEKIKTEIDYLGTEDELLNIIDNYQIKYVVVAKDRKMDKNLVANLDQAKRNAKIYFIDEMYELLSRKLPVLHLSKDYFYFLFRTIEKRQSNFKLYNLVNRIMNLIFAIIGIILSLPFMIVISAIIKIESKGPVFFKQKRVGKNGKPFTCYKFRSMKVHEKENHSKYACKKDPRVTRFGSIMRRLRLDELPQFINILKGDMNLIGPRAEWIELVKKYKKKIPFYNQRHLVRPGLTGWAQVNYPYGQNVQDTIYKLQYDLYYVKNRSFFLDLLIILKTLKIVLTGKGM